MDVLGALLGAAWTLGAALDVARDKVDRVGAAEGALTVGCLAGARLDVPRLGARTVGDRACPEVEDRFGTRAEGDVPTPLLGARAEGADTPPLDGALAEGVDPVPLAGARAEGRVGAAVPPVDGRVAGALAEGVDPVPLAGARAEGRVGAAVLPVDGRVAGALTEGVALRPCVAAPGRVTRSEGRGTAPADAVPGRVTR